MRLSLSVPRSSAPPPPPSDTQAPRFVSGSVPNTAPSFITLVSDEAFYGPLCDPSAFSPSARTAVSVASGGAGIVVVGVNAPYALGDVITCGYTQPAINALQDAAGNKTVSVSISVTNNIGPRDVTTTEFADVWVALPPSGDFSATNPMQSPIDFGGKHAWFDYSPPINKMLHMGGDHGGNTAHGPGDGDNNYRNDSWTCDLTQPAYNGVYADGFEKGMWKVLYNYCTLAPGRGERPHRPDWHAWPYDPARARHMYWAGGEGYPKGSGASGGLIKDCAPDEFADALDSGLGDGNFYPPILVLDPTTGTYTNPHSPLDPYAGLSFNSWGAIIDPVRDEMIRVMIYSAPTLVAEHYNLANPANPWTEPKHYSSDAGENVSLECAVDGGKNRYCFDPVTRKVYLFETGFRNDDHHSGLITYKVDGPNPRFGKIVSPFDFYPNLVGASGFALSVIVDIDTDLRKLIITIIGGGVPGPAYGFDYPLESEPFGSGDNREINRLICYYLDEDRWADETPTKVQYREGAPVVTPHGIPSYIFDPRRTGDPNNPYPATGTTSGASGVVTGYDPNNKLKAVMHGIGSIFIVQMGIPRWVPPEGEASNLTSNTYFDVIPNLLLYPGIYESSSVARSINWTSACHVEDDGIFGSVNFSTGGHNDGGDSSLYSIRIGPNKYCRINNPINIANHLQPGDDGGGVNDKGEYQGIAGAAGTPMASHTYGCLQQLRTVHGGGPQGSVIVLGAYATLGAGNGATRWAHRCDMATGVWSLYSVNGYGGSLGPSATMRDADGHFWRVGPGGTYVSQLKHTTREWTDFGVGGPINLGAGATFSGAYCPQHNVLVLLNWGNPVELWGLLLDDLMSGWHLLNQSGPLLDPLWPAQGIAWTSWLDNFTVYEHQTNYLKHLTPPATSPLSNPWVWTHEAPLGGVPLVEAVDPSVRDPFKYHGLYNRICAIPRLRSLVYFGQDGAVPAQLMRPRS